MNFLHNSDEIEIRLSFYRSFSAFWNIFSGLCTQAFYSSAWGKKLLEVICVVKSKVIQPQPKHKTRNFLKFNSLGKDCPKTFIETRNKYESAIWSHCKHHNTAEFVVCVLSNSSITVA